MNSEPIAQRSNNLPSARKWWPIRLRWRRGGSARFFDTHGIEVEPIKHTGLPAHVWPYQQRLATVVHVGALKIVFGYRGR